MSQEALKRLILILILAAVIIIIITIIVISTNLAIVTTTDIIIIIIVGRGARGTLLLLEPRGYRVDGRLPVYIIRKHQRSTFLEESIGVYKVKYLHNFRLVRLDVLLYQPLIERLLLLKMSVWHLHTVILLLLLLVVPCRMVASPATSRSATSATPATTTPATTTPATTTPATSTSEPNLARQVFSTGFTQQPQTLLRVQDVTQRDTPRISTSA